MSTFFCRHTTLATRSLMRVFMVGHNEAKGIYFVCLFIFSTSAAAVAFLANTFFMHLLSIILTFPSSSKTEECDLLPIFSVMTRQLQDPQDINYHYMIHKGGLFASKSVNVLLEDGKYNFPLQ